ncbi:HAD family hydrolase [Paenibacillus sp. MB22_1]|uniref:HAD family hydrolase n=1 Tax=unclassified Paenibacillus TaxID=185978 RepID=UPI0001AFDC75|nr:MULTISPECIES: HAD family hydrolase [unclassified Paenibacillus]EES71975.1 HAD hydrolase, family IA, variant 1 [Paenibacillus sp. oral taxon 786 str. D14]MCT2194613.1 HAD family hydrolase [Paenibacillus sp. p3-SID1389]
MTIKAVCFDLDDTLLWDERSVKEAFAATCESAASKINGLNPEQLEEAVRREARGLYESYETYPFTTMIGINPFEGLWATFSAGEQPEFRQLEQLAPTYRKESWRRGLLALGVDDEELAGELAEQFGRERRARPHVYEETFQVLKELQGKVKLLLLTNGCPALQQEKLDGVPELAPYFDEIVISGNFGKGKPDPSIFRHALERLGIQSNEAIMVGDKLTTDIKGSLSVGMTAVWINRDGKALTGDIVPDYEIKHLSELHGLLEKLA